MTKRRTNRSVRKPSSVKNVQADQNAGLKVSAPVEGDFFIDGLTIEVGGKNKNSSQVKHLENFLIASNDIEIGNAKKIPIWLFGFLY